jgi:site-specific DNA recombinase
VISRRGFRVLVNGDDDCLDVGAAERIRQRWPSLRAGKSSLSSSSPRQRRRRPFFIPRWRTFYRERVGALHEALEDDTEATRLKAGEILRSLVKAIILAPEVGGLKIDVRGDLAGVLPICLQNENPSHWGWGFQVEMVAETRNSRPHRLAPLIISLSL